MSFKTAKKYGAKVATGAAVVVATVGSAHAALPTEVTTAITSTGTDMVTAITAIIAAFVPFWGLKKLAGKLGWS